jgi:hypothetical protein
VGKRKKCDAAVATKYKYGFAFVSGLLQHGDHTTFKRGKMAILSGVRSSVASHAVFGYACITRISCSGDD